MMYDLILFGMKVIYKYPTCLLYKYRLIKSKNNYNNFYYLPNDVVDLAINASSCCCLFLRSSYSLVQKSFRV